MLGRCSLTLIAGLICHLPALAQNPPGTPLGGEFRVTPAVSDLSSYAVAQYRNGHFLVGWSSMSDGVTIQRFERSGQPVGPSRNITPAGGLKPGRIDLAIGQSGHGGLVWIEILDDVSRSERILLQRLNVNSKPTGPVLRVTQHPGWGTQASVAIGPNGETAVAWGEEPIDGIYGYGKVYLKAYSASGSTLLPTTGVVDAARLHIADAPLPTPVVRWGGALGYLVLWNQVHADYSNTLYVKRVTPQGIPLNSTEITYSITGLNDICMAPVKDEDFMVGWTDHYDFGYRFQRFNRFGQAIHAAFSRQIGCVELFSDAASRLITWDGTQVQMQTINGTTIAGPLTLPNAGTIATGAAADIVQIYPKEETAGVWALFGQRYAGASGSP